MKRALITAALALLVGGVLAGDVSAETRRKTSEGPQLSQHPKARYYRSPQVRGYVQRRGGYSYSIADTLNTYGSSRTLYGGSRMWRDPQLDRQTTSGPFDHGFFFDSGVAPRGGDSPYMH